MSFVHINKTADVYFGYTVNFLVILLIFSIWFSFICHGRALILGCRCAYAHLHPKIRVSSTEILKSLHVFSIRPTQLK